MTEAETRQMIEVLGDTLPPDVANDTEQAVADHLRQICAWMDYRLSEMNKHLPAIIERAKNREQVRAF
jgi:hypothetical protein